jgi:hypothetical protein
VQNVERERAARFDQAPGVLLLGDRDRDRGCSGTIDAALTVVAISPPRRLSAAAVTIQSSRSRRRRSDMATGSFMSLSAQCCLA